MSPSSPTSDYWLSQRLKANHASLNPTFAALATFNWFRALALLVDDDAFSPDGLREFYADIEPRRADEEGDTHTFASAFMAYQNLSGLYTMYDAGQPSDLMRSAIVTWYYGIYHAASAMIAAQDGSVQATHAATANAWYTQIAKRGFIPTPFGFSLSTLVKKACDAELADLRGDNDFTLPRRPGTQEEAHGAYISYLSGTATSTRKTVEDRVRGGKEMRAAGLTDFRKAAAREIRDRYLDGKPVCFVHLAYRSRGKVNYRDALYLGYGDEDQRQMSQVMEDLCISLDSFFRAMCSFCSRRVEPGTWDRFADDLAAHSALSLSPDILRV